MLVCLLFAFFFFLDCLLSSFFAYISNPLSLKMYRAGLALSLSIAISPLTESNDERGRGRRKVNCVYHHHSTCEQMRLLSGSLVGNTCGNIGEFFPSLSFIQPVIECTCNASPHRFFIRKFAKHNRKRKRLQLKGLKETFFIFRQQGIPSFHIAIMNLRTISFQCNVAVIIHIIL